ncbi:MAG: alpha/beta hydrolase [Gemmatimonadaceae bacterium]
MRFSPISIFLVGTMTANVSTAQSTTPGPGRYAPINGLNLYYEVSGEGQPIVLIHGGGSTIGTSFGRILPLLATTHRVIAVELQAHGHTRDIDRPMTFEQDADDVAALLQYLHVPKADILGFSNGGTTALQVAIRHPEVVERLVIASANYKRDGLYSWLWDSMEKGSVADMPQPYKDAYLAINPSLDGLRAMYNRDSKRMLAFRDIPDGDIRSLRAPTLVVIGDQDVVRPEHAIELARLLPHGRLCILPGNHGGYFGEIMSPHVAPRVPQLFVSLLDEFLLSTGG